MLKLKNICHDAKINITFARFSDSNEYNNEKDFIFLP